MFLRWINESCWQTNECRFIPYLTQAERVEEGRARMEELERVMCEARAELDQVREVSGKIYYGILWFFITPILYIITIIVVSYFCLNVTIYFFFQFCSFTFHHAISFHKQYIYIAFEPQTSSVHGSYFFLWSL